MNLADNEFAQRREMAAHLAWLADINEENQASVIVYFAAKDWRVPRWLVSYPRDLRGLAAKVEKGRRP